VVHSYRPLHITDNESIYRLRRRRTAVSYAKLFPYYHCKACLDVRVCRIVPRATHQLCRMVVWSAHRRCLESQYPGKVTQSHVVDATIVNDAVSNALRLTQNVYIVSKRGWLVSIPRTSSRRHNGNDRLRLHILMKWAICDPRQACS
jgi:hypothetical protein